MTAPILSIRSLSAVSELGNAEPILRNVSLDLAPGETLGLVGESGAGKSTIAKALLGVLPRTVRITQGEILFEGRDLRTLPRRETRAIFGDAIALVPQDPMTALNPGRRIEAQLTDGLRLRRGMNAREAHKRALELLAEVHIRDPERVLRSYPHQLSGGMRQRVLIAAAFALEPKIIVADEPTTALDVTVQKQILRLMRQMQEAHRHRGHLRDPRSWRRRADLRPGDAAVRRRSDRIRADRRHSLGASPRLHARLDRGGATIRSARRGA